MNNIINESSYIRRIKAHRIVVEKALKAEFDRYTELFQAGIISGRTFMEHFGLFKLGDK